MRSVISITFLLIICAVSFGQSKPLSQAEYVRLLYSLEKNIAERSDLIDALRRRGIDFTLTDGLRSLTRTKGRNDQELRQALEEANRRRIDPSIGKPPSDKEASELLAKTKEKTLAAVEEMPDFVVKQLIQRSAAYAGTNNFRNLDRLVVAVSYRASGQEEYKVLSVNGAVQTNPEPKRTYEEVGGTSSTGEFVTVLATIFKPESETRFDVVDTDTIRDRRAIIFEFSIERDRAKQQIIASGTVKDSTITGMKGRLWIDRDLHRVLRIESEATEIPESFPIRSARRIIEYDWAAISTEKYLLPSLSDVRLTFRDQSRVFESRNVIRFREYQKFGTEVIIVESDDEPVQEEKPQDR